MPERSKLFACIISPDLKRDEEVLLSIAYSFAYRVELLTDGVLFDVSGLEKLVGNTKSVAREVLKKLKDTMSRVMLVSQRASTPHLSSLMKTQALIMSP